MREVKVKRYIADCGRGFWKKAHCENHEKRCKCWKNPKFKTCLTCIHEKLTNDTNGMESEPQHLHTWVERVCLNPEFVREKHFTPAHEKAPDLCINCPVWEG